VPRWRRRALLKAVLTAGATFAAWPLHRPPELWGAKAGPPKRGGSRFDRLRKKPNILILLNDQQRYERDWPLTWAVQHLPSMQRLKRHGLSFRNVFAAACACSPSRAALLTGTYSAQTGVYHTLVLPGDDSLGGAPAGYSQQSLLPTQPNIARILKAAGYKVAWKGKWHLSVPVNGANSWTTDDIIYMREAYGFEAWNPNDAGNSISAYPTLGGGARYDNDARFVESVRLAGDRDSPPAKSAVAFLREYDPSDGPFCLIVSVVNPHDIWVAPGFASGSGYKEGLGSEFNLPVPENVDEDLSTKPSAQRLFRSMYNAAVIKAFGPSKSLKLPVNQRNCVNFYAYLQTLADQHMMHVLDALDARGLTASTLIVRIADHGEMGLAHGLREKMYNAYEETIHVPLIISNPVLFPQPEETDALVSLIDILPTLAQIAGVYDEYKYVFRGVDLTPVLKDPRQRVQELVHFCYDDGYLVGDVPPYIRAIRTDNWLYAVYFNTAGSKFEYEMYDVLSDPHENVNLAGRTQYEQQLRSLHQQLQEKMQAAGTAPLGIPLVTPQLEAVAHQTHQTSVIPEPHWPTAEEAVTQSRQQWQQSQPDFEDFVAKIEPKGFWMTQTRQ
jgi:arylsulfatase A-like enzyme